MTSFARRLTSHAVLAVWAIGLALPVAGTHARVLDDAACNVAVLSTAHPVDQIEAARPPVDDGHCATCHLQRAIYGAFTQQPEASSHADVNLVSSVVPRDDVHGEPRLTGPSRAPPSAHL